MLVLLVSFATAQSHPYLSSDSLLSGAVLDAISVTGYAEMRASWTDAETTHWSTTERFRPTVKVYLSDRVTLTGTVEAQVNQGRYPVGEAIDTIRDPFEEAIRSNSGLSGDDADVPNLDEVIEICEWDLETTRTVDEVSDVASVQRLYVDVNLPFADIRVGRQALNWGSALFINPTDVFNQILVAEPWQERAGVDALRINIPIGEQSMISGIGSRQSDDVYQGAVKGTAHVGTADISIIGSTTGDEHMFGIDTKGDFFVGWWVEGAYDGAVKVSAGLDYSFPIMDRLYVATQVYHDSSGGAIPSVYDWDSRQDPALAAIGACEDKGEDIDGDGIGDFSLPIATSDSSAEQRLTLGQWYALGMVRLDINETLAATTTIVANVGQRDGTGLVFPTVTYNATDRITLNTGMQYLYGSDGEFQPDPAYINQRFEDLDPEIDLSPLTPTWTALAWARFSL